VLIGSGVVLKKGQPLSALVLLSRMGGMGRELTDEQHRLIRALVHKYHRQGMSIHDSVNRAFREVRPVFSWLTSLHTANTERDDMVRVLGGIDRLLAEAAR
jgi:hypothetical protein